MSPCSTPMDRTAGRVARELRRGPANDAEASSSALSPGRNLLLAWTMAAELPKVPLADALSLLLLAPDQQPWRFETAAPRWHALLCAEARLTLAEAQFAVPALNALAGPAARTSMR
jgi:hypothetical protein